TADYPNVMKAKLGKAINENGKTDTIPIERINGINANSIFSAMPIK
ncbi:MAG: hypothetical protein JRZ95_03775, partial [Nitrososphaerota archaeon]|nr:hypothetical protein [Nitrososphaerota archaeon]